MKKKALLVIAAALILLSVSVASTKTHESTEDPSAKKIAKSNKVDSQGGFAMEDPNQWN